MAKAEAAADSAWLWTAISFARLFLSRKRKEAMHISAISIARGARVMEAGVYPSVFGIRRDLLNAAIGVLEPSLT